MPDDMLASVDAALDGECSVDTRALLAAGEKHPIEKPGAKLRSMMPWIGKNKMVDTTRN